MVGFRLLFFISFFLVLLVVSVSGLCVVSLDKNAYFPKESPVATALCSLGNEAGQTYTMTFTNGTDDFQSFAGITPTQGTPFFETITIPDGANWTNANVTLTGVNLEGEDFFNVTGASANSLRFINSLISSTILIGRTAGFETEVIDSNEKLISGADCVGHIEGGDGIPITTSPRRIISSDGFIHVSRVLDVTAFTEEDVQHVVQISCNCGKQDTAASCFDEDGNSVDYKSGSGEIPFTVDRWLTVNTVTDDTTYHIDDEQIRVCANISNNNSERIPINILYDVRCFTNDNTTDRVVIDSFIEKRGISAQTVQMQCALLDINNVATIQDKVSSCYASTLVSVESKKDAGDTIFSYFTTSDTVNITSNSTIFVEGEPMNGLAIIFFLVAINFAVFFLGFKGEFHNRKSLNNFYKKLTITAGLFLLSLNTAIVSTVADVSGIPVLNELFTYMFVINWAAIVLIMYIGYNMISSTLKLWKDEEKVKRSGTDDNNGMEGQD